MWSIVPSGTRSSDHNQHLQNPQYHHCCYWRFSRSVGSHDHWCGEVTATMEYLASDSLTTDHGIYNCTETISLATPLLLQPTLACIRDCLIISVERSAMTLTSRENAVRTPIKARSRIRQPVVVDDANEPFHSDQWCLVNISKTLCKVKCKCLKFTE